MLRTRYIDKPFADIVAKRKLKNPIYLVIFGYLMTIVIGTLLLSLPISTKVPIRFIDALFTSTSAVCVTGLSVLDIRAVFSDTGLWVITFLMQVGGLGIMTFSTALLLISGMRPGFNQQVMLQENFTQDGRIDSVKVLWAVIPFTLLIEAFGAIIFFLEFSDLSIGTRILYAVFHSVSSFCNVGFAPWADSLVRFQFNPVMNIATSLLIIAGGFGFLAISEARYLFNFKTRTIQRISLHTKIAFFCTVILIVAGAVSILLMEWHTPALGTTFIQKLTSALFISVSSRTAGFNTLNLLSLGGGTLFLIAILMFVGANPGSCGGGIKTTTAALIALLGFNRLLGREKTQVLGRTIPEETVDKAVRIFVVSILIVVVFTIILLQTEYSGTHYSSSNTPFLKVLFEVISAYATCGLSMGLTPELTDAGRLIICMVMFIGRLGALFLISAVIKKADTGAWYAEENIMVG